MPGITKKYSIIIASTGLLILLLTVSAAFVVVWKGAEDIKKSLKESTSAVYTETHQAVLKNLAAYLRQNLFNSLYQLDIERINRLINDMREGMPVKSFIVADPSGRALTDGTKENSSFGRQLDIDFKGIKSSPVIIEKTEDGSRVVFLIGTNGYTAGYGEIIFSDAPLKKALKIQDATVLQAWDGFKSSFFKIALAGTVILAFITFILGVLFSRTLSVPILKLTEATRNIAAGDMSHRVVIETADEIGELAGSFNAMTERLQKEIKSRTEKEQLLMNQSKLAAMGEMIGNIAHQWRQPLNAVGIIIQDFKDAYEFGELNKEYIDNNVKQGMRIIQHMSKTIDDFRNFFRPDKEKQEFSIKEAVDKTISLVEAGFKSSDIRLDPDIKEDAVIYGFQNEYSQVLMNILNNAKDALLDNEIKEPFVKISLLKEDNKTALTVSDNAGGIPEEIIGRIFEPYFSTKEEGKGTGIGLYMSRIIIESHMSGRLTVRNINGGAEFRIEV
jgi:signal transduction histidine kinase